MLLEIREIYKKHAELLNKELELNGWIRKRRDQKNFGFLEVNDGTFFNGIQVVFDDSLSNFDEISRLSISSSVHVKGVLVQSEGKGQTFEIKAKEITIYNKADLDYPLQNKRHTLEYLRTIAHLRPRTNTFMAVFRVRSLMSYAIHKFFNERGFVYVHTPIITGSDTEGAGEMFQLTTLDLKDIPKNDKGEVEYKDDFFGKQANLTVSGQLNVETFCMAFKKLPVLSLGFAIGNLPLRIV